MTIYRIDKNNKYNYIHNKFYYPIIDLIFRKNMSNNVAFLRNQNHQTLSYLYNQNIKDKIIPDDIINKILDKNKTKIILYSPPPLEACGGIMVMHNLAKTIMSINDPNIEVFIYYYDHKIYENNFCNNFLNPFKIDDKTIVIYPETIVGNPLNANHVVRWILLDLGLDVPLDHYKNWNPHDIVYHWEPTKLKNIKQLVNIWVNPKINRYNYEQRDSVCYAIKKMQWIANTLHPNGLTKYHDDTTINIDKMNTDEIIDIFNKSMGFYCYDPNTFYSIMAPLCGCITILHPIDKVDKKEYFKSRILYHKDTDFYFDSGIAYGNEKSEIKKALNTVDQAPEKFKKLVDLYKNTVHSFIRDMHDLVDNKPLTNTVNKIYYRA